MKFGLDVSNMGQDYADPRNLVNLAVGAEEAGWDGFFIWDILTHVKSLIHIVDPLVVLSAIAVRTRRIKIGFLVTPLPRRRPWKVARELVSLDHLSNGRLILGVGSGFNPKDFSSFGEETDPKIRGERLDEALEILAGLWTGEPFSFQGKYYQVKNVRFLPRPFQSPRIPIWVGGYWPNKKPFRRAARWDGVYPGSDTGQLTPERIREILTYVNKHRKCSGPFDVVIWGLLPKHPERRTETIKAYSDAGLTWWNTPISPYRRRPFEEMKKLVQNGPPKGRSMGLGLG